jgi:hypothetical protein
MTDTCLANLLATDMLESKYSLTEIRHKDVHAEIPLSKTRNPKLENSKLILPDETLFSFHKIQTGPYMSGKSFGG